MSDRFEDFVQEIENAATPEERRELEAARARYRIGTRLLQQRLTAGLTQKQLASESGIDQGDISRIERGEGNPTTETLDALSRPLGVTLDLVTPADA
ncbi:MAG TPA: helix-turn-helix transcriptional regulator [Solirubrobacterales bacterium]|nr:helix-turn-helix transcriptional regulator [Solirubrobacterales bacterium]